MASITATVAATEAMVVPATEDMEATEATVAPATEATVAPATEAMEVTEAMVVLATEVTVFTVETEQKLLLRSPPKNPLSPL